MPRIDLGKLTLHYHQSGTGTDVILIHGFTSNLAIWLLTNIVGTLAEDFRVTAYDLRGHGMSDIPPGGYTSADMADDLYKLHDALELGPAYIVGHSFGGVIGIHAARRYPQIVAGVIVADSYFPGLADLEPNMEHAESWQNLRAPFQKAGCEIGPKVDFVRLFEVVAGLTPQQLEVINDELGPASVRWLATLPQLASTTAARDMSETAGLTAAEIVRVEQPVVALYDEHSPFMTTCRYLDQQLPQGSKDIVADAKHLALLENTESFVRQVREHLRRMAGTSRKAAGGVQ